MRYPSVRNLLKQWFRRADYDVKMLGAHRIAYIEGARRVVLDGERLASGGPVAIWYSFLRTHEWDAPRGEPVTDAEKALIKERIEQRMKEHGIIVEVTEF